MFRTIASTYGIDSAVSSSVMNDLSVVTSGATKDCLIVKY